MRSLKGLLLLFVIAGIAWWSWDEATDFKQAALGYIENGDILTMEAHYTPERIMAANQQGLLGDGGRTFLDPVVKFYPYLLMDVKYLQEGKSKEGTLLWGLEDGEMVLNAETWETTHGLEDCLVANANGNDFKIVNAIARHKGSMTKEALQDVLNLEPEVISPWVESARQKHLIVQKGNLLQLHFENPKIPTIPQTKGKQTFVSKSVARAQRKPSYYSPSRIAKVAQAAFGSDFTVRSQKEVFLPVYTIEVQNPDGSIRRSDWNALTGQPFSSKV